ncbi:hypothetical protein [Microlunatus elymi]|uniref:hypothetical protein n=1 Tax=Microlunatus elymi TaxID=2596828 RepID=UPI001AEF671B|nr:hypothetical protein [Microlunatus elymi]
MAWQDPWAGAASDAIMRTGTGVLLDSQDGSASPELFLRLLDDLGADFYLHHVMPDLHGQSQMIKDVAAAGLQVVLGNEYGNINGPYTDGTNRYDLPDRAVAEATEAGMLAGVLYDEPEHLQMNAGQYRQDAFLPHFGSTEGRDSAAAERPLVKIISEQVRKLEDAAGVGPGRLPVLAEQVFPVMFHTFARAGMTPCPKVMKESFQPLQLATALGAALQYGRQLWICADLWGPDIGPWFTRAPGFPGHSPAEYAAALRMAYLFGPTHLFTENVDVLARYDGNRFHRTEFGEVWAEFVRDFVPAHPLEWTFRDARPSSVLIHAEDSDFGRGVRPFGDRQRTADERSASIFQAWHLLSRGTIPRHGSCLHIEGFASPRKQLNQVPRPDFPLPSGVPQGDPATTVHPLFHASTNTVVYDETVGLDRLGSPELIMVAGSRLTDQTRQLVRHRAESGATVIIADWLTTPEWSRSRRVGEGRWIVTDQLDGDEAREAADPLLGPADRWTQRFGDTELRFSPGTGDPTALEIEMIKV